MSISGADTSDSVHLLTPRAPNAAERTKLVRRLRRLTELEASAETATRNMIELAARKPKLSEIRIRESFVRRAEPAPGDYSDRKTPPRHLRPPATRLVSPNGAALRIFLTALFEAQTSAARAGDHPTNARPLRGTRDEIGWIDLIASAARHSPKGSAGAVTANDKKLRQLDNTLKRLAEDELVLLPNARAGAGKRENFELMDEGGPRVHGPNERYLLPKPNEAKVFGVPVTLFTQGWIHCLEDTELALLLLLAERGAQHTAVKIEGEIRLRHYGLGRDAYEAHIMLNRLGLITIQPDPRRRTDGTVEDYAEEGGYLHAFTLLPGSFDRPALSAVTSAITSALDEVEIV